VPSPGGRGPGRLGPADWAALRFTLWQALLSALISVGLAVPVARALARRRFPGRGALITLMGAPFILPVARGGAGAAGGVRPGRGWSMQLWLVIGLPPVSIYGFHGCVLAHVFFNLPLATRLILQGWLGSRPNGSGWPPRLGIAAGRRLVDRGADAGARWCPARFGDLPDLPDQLCRGPDAGRRAARHDGGTGDLSGVALRFRPGPRGAGAGRPRWGSSSRCRGG
jgi:hypothetical protein